MVRGADYNFTFTVKNKTTGQPIVDPSLVNGMELVLTSSKEKKTLKEYSLGNGIESLGEGKYKITISADDTLLLPTIGRALLEGFTVPVRRSVIIDMGVIGDNQSNYPV